MPTGLTELIRVKNLAQSSGDCFNDILGVNDFPCEVFPRSIRDYIIEYEAATSINKDLFVSGVIAALSMAANRKYVVDTKLSRLYGSLAICVIAPSASGKSPAQNAAILPIIERDNNYKIENERLDKEVEAYNSMEPEERKKANKPTEHRRKLIIGDATTEAIITDLKYNPLLWHVDEFTALIGGLNKYNNGSGDADALNTLMDNRPFTKTRSGGGKTAGQNKETYIPNPYITILGGTVPDRVNEIAAGGRRTSGFMYRILFIKPNKIGRLTPIARDIDAGIINRYKNLIESILDTPETFDNYGQLVPITLTADSEASDLYNKWFERCEDIKEAGAPDYLRAIIGKMYSLCYRLALLLQLSYNAEERRAGSVITSGAMSGAISLSNYFITTANNIHNEILCSKDAGIYASALEGKDTGVKEVELYCSLPDRFKRAEGITIAAAYGMSERTFVRFISDKKLFKLVAYGIYEKRINTATAEGAANIIDVPNHQKEYSVERLNRA